MKVPIDWLKELVSFRAGADQLAEMLTNAGLETTVLPDEILEVDVLPNRADCWCVRGIAREISAITRFKMKGQKVKVKTSIRKPDVNVWVEVRDKDLCPRYMARVIENVKVGESPEWLKKKLERAGMRSINNVVDVTNYVLHEIGQPMHAFDASLINGQSIVVRRANPEEKVVTLDGKEHILNPEVLVIADSEKVIAVAGMMGCANTEVSASTQNIILESAYFNPISIHRNSKTLKIRTESSVRFEHGVDWAAVEEALDWGAALIAELGRGEAVRVRLDVKAKERKPKIIELRLSRLRQILGIDVPVGDITAILKRLGFEIVSQNNKILKVEVPLFRAMDIEREIDIIEEIARINGLGRIPSILPNTAFSGKEIDRGDLLRNKIREVMAGCGLNEVQTYSMLDPKDFEMAKLSIENAIKIANPLTIEESVLRTHMLPGLLKTATHNQNRQVENVFIFEIGKVFASSSEKLPNEKWVLGGVVMGSPFMSALDKGEADYFYVKGILENLFETLVTEMPKVIETENLFIQPGRGAEIEGVGIFGALHPDLQRNFGLAKAALFFEIDLDALLKLSSGERKCQPLPKFPSISRDISMFVPSDLANQAILELIRKVGGDLVEKVFPFDKYKESVAYRVVYRNPERTLTEEEVNKKHQEIVQALVSNLGAKLR